MTRYTPMFLAEQENVIAVGAVMADSSKWVRWFCDWVMNGKDFPRIISYKTRREARNHARAALRWGKREGVFSPETKSKVIEIHEEGIAMHCEKHNVTTHRSAVCSKCESEAEIATLRVEIKRLEGELVNAQCRAGQAEQRQADRDAEHISRALPGDEAFLRTRDGS